METCRRRNVMFYLVTFYYEMLIFRYQNRKLLTIICNTRGMFPEPFSLAGLCLSVFFRFPQGGVLLCESNIFLTLPLLIEK